jgi:molecular chaperone DnaK
LNVSAKDKKTGKENKITIKSDSGLSEDEIKRMICEGEENEESDRKTKALIEIRNRAEGDIHSIGKDFDKYKDQLTDEDKITYETKLNDLQEIMKGEDVEAIEQALGNWFETTKPFMAIKHAEQAQKEDQTGFAQSEKPADAQTVDAAFKEVDDTEKK